MLQLISNQPLVNCFCSMATVSSTDAHNDECQKLKIYATRGKQQPILVISYLHYFSKFSLKNKQKLECGSMPNPMVALPNIDGALCSTPQSLADAHYLTAVSNAAKTRKPLKLAGVPQTTGSISAASRRKFTILWGHLEEILLLNKFFSDCRHVPQLRRYSPTKLYDSVQMATFWRFFASCMSSKPRAARFRPAS